MPIADRAESWSKWLLAGGIALAAARAVNLWLRRGRARLPVRAAAFVVLIALLAGTALASAPVRERLARAGLPAAAPGRPNVLLIILDTVRAASLGLYGYDRPTTPNLERLGASSVVFEQAIAPSSWTLPSHATLMTGRYPNELSADWEAPLDRTYPTLAEVLAARGYATAAFSANGAYANALTGLGRGFARYEDFPATAGEAVRTSLMFRRMLQRLKLGELLRDGHMGRKSAADIGGAFLDWLAGKPADRPFFVFLNYFDAHDPYEPAPPFDTLFGPRRPLPRLNWGRPPSAELVEAWTDDYDRAIAYLDHELGLLFEELDRRGVLDSTVVVITADHGEHLGEHGFMRHGTTLYLPVLHVPLIVRFPPVTPESVRVATPVTLRDVPATMLDLAGIEGTPIPGASLVTTWSGDGAPSSPLYSEVREAVRIPARYPNAAADVQSLFANGMHYIRVLDGGEELYR
ncbi:MAG: sulfatase, partial [Longimicrobiales bacterium]